jgi:hypothetical protein
MLFSPIGGFRCGFSFGWGHSDDIYKRLHSGMAGCADYCAAVGVADQHNRSAHPVNCAINRNDIVVESRQGKLRRN